VKKEKIRMKKIKGILLDIDNTLYDYESCHQFAMDKCRIWIKNHFNINEHSFNLAFKESRRTINERLRETAASHNRLLYFQLTLEKLEINSLKYSLLLYNCYWDNFLSYMNPFKGIEYIFQKYNGNICFVTDLTAHIQHRKITRLDLAKYLNHLVTSEEAGCEKPDQNIFKLALEKLNLEVNEVCMIGDNFNKDIIGANNLSIQSIWLNRTEANTILPENCIEIKDISSVNKYI
jgi:HAD superfamily hydrolase (TIGR01549 family)